jgi:DNA-binding XRE family transcriptional regulator
VAVAVRDLRYVPPQNRHLVRIENHGETLGQLFRRRRLELGMGQKEVAAAIGIPSERQSWISRVERDVMDRPNKEWVDSLGALYGISPETIAMGVHRLGRVRQTLPPTCCSLVSRSVSSRGGWGIARPPSRSIPTAISCPVMAGRR